MPNAPEFNRGRLSYGDTRTLQKLQIRAGHLDKQIAAAGPDDDIDALLDKQDALMAQVERILTRAIVSVPRDWLVDDAPDDIDWQADGLKWVRADKFGSLFDPQDTSGN